MKAVLAKPSRESARQAGFTLIEIMVVVFILGLLITLVAPRILGRTDEARQTKAAADIKSIEQALSLYKLDNGSFPITEQGTAGAGRATHQRTAGTALECRRLPGQGAARSLGSALHLPERRQPLRRHVLRSRRRRGRRRQNADIDSRNL
jgi:type II secretion system protein G